MPSAMRGQGAATTTRQHLLLFWEAALATFNPRFNLPTPLAHVWGASVEQKILASYLGAHKEPAPKACSGSAILENGFSSNKAAPDQAVLKPHRPREQKYRRHRASSHARAKGNKFKRQQPRSSITQRSTGNRTTDKSNQGCFNPSYKRDIKSYLEELQQVQRVPDWQM